MEGQGPIRTDTGQLAAEVIFGGPAEGQRRGPFMREGRLEQRCGHGNVQTFQGTRSRSVWQQHTQEEMLMIGGVTNRARAGQGQTKQRTC